LLSIHLELMDFKTRRISHFKKNLVELAELELKHARVSMICNMQLFNVHFIAELKRIKSIFRCNEAWVSFSFVNIVSMLWRTACHAVDSSYP